MDKKKNPGERSEGKEQFQLETGRGIDSLVSTSPLFYTVSGPYSQSRRQGESPRYYEQLGCPSILKPSFRDLAGCTRLSVGVPSVPYRQYPLDKLNKTIMGRSSAVQGNGNSSSKRFTRGEKYLAPIKVNAKIRHIYSHITSSSQSQWSQSQESSLASTSTQTEFEEIAEKLYKNVEVADDDSIVEKKDASTCMSPPPPLLTPSPVTTEPYYYSPAATVSSSTDRLFSVPSSYAGKLEDLEKITGHIVIQRFFTRADEAFGCWLEKQLGMNNKSVGVDTAESPINADEGISRRRRSASTRRSEVIDELSPVDEVASESEETAEIECSIDDLIQCECFKDQYDIAYAARTASTADIEPPTKDLGLMEEELISQCITYEIHEENSKAKESPLENDSQLESKVTEAVQSDIDKTETKRFSGSIDHEVTEELIRNLDQLIEEASANEENNVMGKISSEEYEVKADNTNASELVVVSQSQEESEARSPVVENLARQNAEDEDSQDEEQPERPCFPDIINVSDIYASDAGDTEVEMDQSNGTIDLNQSSMESQCKVVEYLGKLDRSVLGEPLPGEIEVDGYVGESSGEMVHPEVEGLLLKRSVSVDSCIGTESSGETRQNLNDSGINLDSGRHEGDVREATPSISEKGNEDSTFKTLEENPTSQLDDANASSELHDSQEQELTMISNKSIDESNSRSDLSSAIKRISDGEDADQSESDSELGSLKRATAGNNMSAVMEEFEEKEDHEEDAFLLDVDDNEQSEDVDELDQFDIVIESHAKEKNLRPVCRKRNVSTQTSRSIESSIASTTTSRSTTATSTSDSSFDLEFVSKSKKYMSHLSSGSNNSVLGTQAATTEKKRSYLPSGSSSLNVLNMKFTMGREFESEVSIRIPPKSPSTNTTNVGLSSSLSKTKGGSAILHSNLNSASTTKIGDGSARGRSSQQATAVQDSELKTLWKEIKSKMESRVGESQLSLPQNQQQNDLSVKGNRMKLIPIDSEFGGAVGNIDSLDSPRYGQGINEEGEGSRFLTSEEERIKRSLKRLKKILED